MIFFALIMNTNANELLRPLALCYITSLLLVPELIMQIELKRMTVID